MKLSRVKRPTPKPQRATGPAGAREYFGRWALDSGPRPCQNLGTWNLELGTSPRSGVALVVTLIMLSIITFLAVAFLVLSQRENASSNTAMDQKTAKMAADSAFNRVCAELLADAMVNTNFQNFGMKVSTNYISIMGFNPGLVNPLLPNNVNYDYLTNAYGLGGPPLASQAQWQQNIASLEFNPRAPVFVVTNPGTGAMDFRYYIDLNQNGHFERNGLWPVVVADPSVANTFDYITTNGSLVKISSGPPYPTLISNNFVGDPEWIGVLERPQELHSADNRFISRYAYLVVPAGNTLDINSIHNRAKLITTTGEGFYRNQGVGTYEGNLAGFLADLNTNMWWSNAGTATLQYFYTNNPNFASSGLAFVNANDLLSYRYGSPGYNSLNRANQLFPNAAAAWGTANIDLYSSGPLMLGNNVGITPAVGQPWSGADNTNHVWSIQDFLSSSLSSASSFPANLKTLGGSNDSYNAYTYYRMLSQLGSDSAPEKYKINVNWKNIDSQGNVVPGMETNQFAWNALDFFTNAADRMFRYANMHDLEGKLITVTNIPFYEAPSNPTYGTTNINYYTPAVHRILQLAANIYDATTTRFINGGPTNYPSVFRPVFRSFNGVASIAGYMEVSNTADAFLPFLEKTNFVLASQTLNTNVNIYGVPWVIGAKKGFPNFNEMSMLNEIGVQRELEFTNKASLGYWQTNQLFNFYFTNRMGIEGWNSYSNRYSRPLTLYVSNLLSIIVTNDNNQTILQVVNYPYGTSTNITSWAGGAKPQVQFFTNNIFTNGNYAAGQVLPLNPVKWTAQQLPRMFMSFDFKLHYVLMDTTPGVNRIIDFVNLVGPQPQLQPTVQDPMDVSMMLASGANEHIDLSGGVNHGNDIFATNFWNGILDGVLNQISAEEGTITLAGTPKDNTLQLLQGLAGFDDLSGIGVIEQSISWQANDPLVHYTAQDLTSMEGKLLTYNRAWMVPPGSPPPPYSTSLPNLGQTNFTYRPWPNNPQNADQVSGSDSNFRMKDSLTINSDAWDFPTNKLWDIGILGRVHRGTPWQTVYLKPTNGLSLNNWAQWANDPVIVTNFGNVVTFDAANTLPSQDYLLFDLFTSAPNENSTRGQLNINQPGLAAWSAILSGVNVISRNSAGQQIPVTISPAGVYDPNNPTPLAQIWQGITATRTNANPTNGPVFPNATFQHLGDILNTPQLTVASPFVNSNNATDEELERIPQQVMSLLTLNQDPRFVIYSFGQTLHPADHSQVTGGSFNGLCTNYQITAETATRAVVRVEGSPDPQYTKTPDPQGRYYPPHIVVEQFNVLGPD